MDVGIVIVVSYKIHSSLIGVHANLVQETSNNKSIGIRLLHCIAFKNFNDKHSKNLHLIYGGVKFYQSKDAYIGGWTPRRVYPLA